MVSLSYPIEALDPVTHTFSVMLVAPPKTELGLWVTTPYGANLRVLDSTLADPSCQQDQQRLACRLDFPTLEAQRPGVWDAHLRKLSSPPAKVEVTFSFRVVGK